MANTPLEQDWPVESQTDLPTDEELERARSAAPPANVPTAGRTLQPVERVRIRRTPESVELEILSEGIEEAQHAETALDMALRWFQRHDPALAREYDKTLAEVGDLIARAAERRDRLAKVG